MSDINSQTITIKVDLSSCQECAQKIKKFLLSVKGVESLSIDVNSGMVILSGLINQPQEIINGIKKHGKVITFYSVQSNDDGQEQRISKLDKQCHETIQDFGECSTASTSKRQQPQPVIDDNYKYMNDNGGRGEPHVSLGNESNNLHDIHREAGNQEGQEHIHRVHGLDHDGLHFSAVDEDQARWFHADEGVDVDHNNVHHHHHANQGHAHHHYTDHHTFGETHLHDNHSSTHPSWSFTDLPNSCQATPHRRVHFEDELPTLQKHNNCKGTHRRVHFEDELPKYRNSKSAGFDTVHYNYMHYPEMRPHYQGQIPRQQFKNDPVVDFVTKFFSDDGSSGCSIM